MDIVKYLKRFDQKKSPLRISYNHETAKNWDMYSVYIHNTATNAKYMFESFDGELVHAKELNKENSCYEIPVTLPVSSLKSNYFSGTYYYKLNELSFFNLSEISPYREYLFQKTSQLRNKLTRLNIFLYRRKSLKKKGKLIVLDTLLNLYLEEKHHEPVASSVLMLRLHGGLWALHDDSQKMLKELHFILNAYVATGDVRKIDEFRYSPSPKAFLTQAEHYDSEKKYKGTARIQFLMLFTSFLSFVAAAASAYAAYKQLK